MTRQELIKLDKIIRMLKSAFIFIMPDKIIGCDNTLVLVSEIDISTGVNMPYEYEMSRWTEFIKAIMAEENERPDYLPWIAKFSIKRFSTSPIMVQYNNMRELQCRQISFTLENFESTDQYESYKCLKAADGAKLIKLDRKHMFYLASGMLPANKGEKIDIVLRDILAPNDNGEPVFMGFLASFYIHKKGGILLHRAISFRALC